jgi:hypothetical protein
MSMKTKHKAGSGEFLARESVVKAPTHFPYTEGKKHSRRVRKRIVFSRLAAFRLFAMEDAVI